MNGIYEAPRAVGCHNEYPINGIFISKRLARLIARKTATHEWTVPVIVLLEYYPGFDEFNVDMVSLVSGTLYITKK